ncbi:uncharacterized protein LOC111641425 [Centruroides sculpturatus]|uniref:uncharacterized protein LOC111641425 n=1 Tax=Centruroides sculpturatus TaxID=218467 RepID=UPI000C6EE172|nr:uncharacterized protein LOC111641425 [Centruroides sculpturatus]
MNTQFLLFVVTGLIFVRSDGTLKSHLVDRILKRIGIDETLDKMKSDILEKKLLPHHLVEIPTELGETALSKLPGKEIVERAILGDVPAVPGIGSLKEKIINEEITGKLPSTTLLDALVAGKVPELKSKVIDAL